MSIRALAAKTVLRIGDKFAGSPTCAEAPALIRDRGESVAHGDDGVGVRGAALRGLTIRPVPRIRIGRDCRFEFPLRPLRRDTRLIA